ncbi:DUF998 domain-containing protein [Pseudonocardia xishanensis]|uniref:DUF998 domain-containing protein n=1 Tax=Pseudonocardia xishanensis TaxID=630995 RepID=A0ABP8S268_9PSEU
MARVSAQVALAGIGIAVVLILGLTLVVDQVDPVRRTISEYALVPELKPIFDVGVLAFAVATVAALLALAGARIVRWWSVGSAGLVLGAAGLVAVVVFEKVNWAVGPSLTGYIHRYASLVAFVALPVAAIAIGRAGRAAWPRAAGWARWTGTAALAWFSPILVGVAQRPLTGVSWWRAIPLGLVERGLALTVVLAVGALAVWGLVAAHSLRRSEVLRGIAPADAG